MNEFFPSALLAPGSPHYRMRLVVGEHSARHIRRVVRSLLAEWGMGDVVDAAELAVTELVANVVRHVPDRRCTVLVVRRRTGVRVEVADGSPGLPVVVLQQPEDSEGGRGLLLLDAIVDKWGVDFGGPGNGKAVWFECRSAGPAAAVR
ncbi:ATP-binding protein [Streptomyces sp. NPDC048664]|uniref:ATP-binding protein n=1 Tax=Streptomyces sp. NPDC048664 TaxID=3154505 RepID=UPI0034135FE0